MQYELKIFEYLDHNPFRVVDIDGNPWFVLADVCRHLDLKPKNGSFSHHADRLDDDERRTVPASILREASPSGREVDPRINSMLVINESGLYGLILRSDKPQAKKFRKWVTSEVLPSIRRTGAYDARAIPAFIRRFNHNWDRIEVGYFSVLSELVVRLWGRLEQLGCFMKDQSATGIELRPDVSVGLRFSKWMKKHHPLVSAKYKEYMHWTPVGDFPARQYSNDVWPLFIEYVDTVWIPEHGPQYFKTRDPVALSYLPRLLPPSKRRPVLAGL